MADLDELRRKKMEDLSRQQDARQKELDAEARVGQVVSALLEPDARARLNNVKMVNKERYMQAVQYLLALAQSGRIQGKVDDESLKGLLTALAAGKKDITIKRK